MVRKMGLIRLMQIISVLFLVLDSYGACEKQVEKDPFNILGKERALSSQIFSKMLEKDYRSFVRTEPISSFKEIVMESILNEVVISVEDFGAVGDGITDDTEAFKDAWEEACSSVFATLFVPEGKMYLLKPINFSGPCQYPLVMQISGTLVAPKDPNVWIEAYYWLLFYDVNNLVVGGGGKIDGRGKKWWAESCKINKTNPCRPAPTAVTFDSINNLWVRNLSIQNSPKFHLTFEKCVGVEANYLKVSAPQYSPNTDGIHISASTYVMVTDSIIGTGDDCISIITDSFNVMIQNITCGPGHGISIGSLGKGNSAAEVSFVVVDGAYIHDTTNGLRIKTWQGGSGYAQGISYSNVYMRNVSNPIIIDQYYCAISHCGGVPSHANVLQCLVATLLTETFPLGIIYSPKTTDVNEHIGSVFFKEGGAMTRAMCDQYLWASRDLKKIVEHLMWEFSYTLHQNHRLYIGMHCTNHKHTVKALENITEAAFFTIVMFFSTATKEESLDELLSVTALDALSYVEYFRVQHMQMQLPEYREMIKCTVLCVSKNSSATAALVHRLPPYDKLTQLPGTLNLLSSKSYWYKDELQTARIFFYLRILPACMEKISGAIFQLEIAPLMFLYMRHPDKNVVQGSHSVFVAFIQASNLGLDSSNFDKDDAISLKEQLVVYYVQTALEEYPCLTPFKALSSAVGSLVRHLPAGSPAVLYCINVLVEKLNSLYSSYFVSSMDQGAEVESKTEALKNLQTLLLNLILLVDIQVLPDLLKLLAQLIIGLPKNAQNIALGDAHDLLACSDDVTRKPILVPWLQSLAFICSRFNLEGSKTKKRSDESNHIDGNNLQLKPDTGKSGSLSVTPTCQNHLEHLSRL